MVFPRLKIALAVCKLTRCPRAWPRACCRKSLRRTFMKTKYTLFLTLTLLFGVGCSNGSSGNSNSTTTTATTVHSYGYLNGSCYDYTAATYVDVSYCASSTSTTSTSYYWNNGYCYSSTGQIVTSSYCSGATSTTTTATTGVCNGYYLYNYNGYQQFVMCYGTNCRGYTLTEYMTGRQITCQ